MKKTMLSTVLFFVSLSVFAQNGRMVAISGTVELKQPGAANFAAAKVGDTVNKNTVISTRLRSSALVEIESVLITVRPLTNLTLTEIQTTADSETISVGLQAGRVRVDVNPPAGTRASTGISSPIATASVRGTSFEFDTRNIYVNHGSVSFSGTRGRPMFVKTGSASTVEEANKAVDPLEVKTEGLLPSMPVGSGIEIPGGFVILRGEQFSITLMY